MSNHTYPVTNLPTVTFLNFEKNLFLFKKLKTVIFNMNKDNLKSSMDTRQRRLSFSDDQTPISSKPSVTYNYLPNNNDKLSRGYTSLHFF